MSLTPTGSLPPISIDIDALRSTLATALPPGFATLHGLNTTLDVTKNIPGVSGGIPKLYNIPPTFSKAFTVNNQVNDIQNLLTANPVAVANAIAAGADIPSMTAVLGAATSSLADFQTNIIGDKNAIPGAPGSAGFAKLTDNVSIGSAVEGANAAQSSSGLCDFLNSIFDFLAGVGDAISSALSAIASAIGSALSVVGDIIGGVLTGIAGVMQLAISAIAGAVQLLADAMAIVLDALANGIADLINFLSSITLPNMSLNPCAKQGLAKVASAAGAKALNTATGGVFV